MIKTFKALLADGGQDKIYLAGGDSTKGYRIVKLQGITNDPGIAGREHVLKIYKVPQTSVTGTIDFNDDALIGTIFVTNRDDALSTHEVVIFDTEVINQDIYVTHFEAASSPAAGGSCNYYIELEEVTMSDAEAANVNFVAALLHT